jgi:PEP-CTERM motif
MIRSRREAPRDSWGVETAFGSAYGDYQDFGTQNLTGTTQSFGASSGTSVSTTSVGVTVGQSYKFQQPNILKVTETITNTSSSTLTGVVFQRDIDWDVAPTEFDENSFGGAIKGNVNDSSYYGFENPDPSVAYGSSCSLGCNQVGDLGGGINVTLGTLAAGASVTQIYLYGISELGESVNGLIAEANADGAYYWVATQSSENGLYPNLGANSAIIAVASGVPEPSTWAMMALGVIGLGFAARRGRKAAVAIA